MSAFLGQVNITLRPVLGQVEYACPVSAPAYDPTLNCMRDARGNTVCSDGSHYPPGCPHTPPDQYFTPGVTPDVTTGGRIEGQIPSPRGAASAGPVSGPGATSGGSSILPIAIGGVAVAGLAAVLFL
jgi:hypothetical protein